MQNRWITFAPIALTAIVAAAAACSGTTTEIPPSGTGGASVGTGGSSSPTGGTTTMSTGGTTSTGGSGTTTGGTTFATGGSDAPGTGGSTTAGTSTTGGTGPSTGGTSSTGGTGPSTGGGGAASGPYAPRTGSFKMLVYSRNVTGGFHHDSIPAGQKMLQDMGQKQGFEVVINANDNDNEITAANLAKYEIVFFMNSTGEIFDATARKAYEDWMKVSGAYGGVHSATDTASSWAFYKEMTGQYYDGHNACCGNADVKWTTDGQDFVAVKGLPSPWTRGEEWYKFNKYQDWSTKTGFKILGTVTTSDGGTRPVSFVREWGNFRSFYTSLGHESKAFQDATVIKHITAGVMWAVRREALIKP